MTFTRFKTVVDDRRRLSVVLPAAIHAGEIEVVVLQEPAPAAAKGPSDEAFAALMAFHKGRRLDGLSLRDLKNEGRR